MSLILEVKQLRGFVERTQHIDHPRRVLRQHLRVASAGHGEQLRVDPVTVKDG